MIGRNLPQSPGEGIASNPHDGSRSDTSRMMLLDKNSSSHSMSRNDDTYIQVICIWVSHATVGSGLGAVDASGILSIHIPRMKITSPFHSRAILLGISLALPATMTDASGSERKPDSDLGLVDLLPDHPRSTVNEIDGPLPVVWKAADQGECGIFARPVILTGADSSQLTCWSHGKSIATSLGADQLRSNHDTLSMEHSEEKSAAKVQPYLPDYFEPKAGMPVRHKAPSLQRVVEFVEVEHRVDGFFPGGFLCPRTHGTQDIETAPRDGFGGEPRHASLRRSLNSTQLVVPGACLTGFLRYLSSTGLDLLPALPGQSLK
ncbi:uncharacterized protein BO96DRAFT_437009 [Aspergillus niger CBS 101883]|uniref:uncharacterized protein n=1 Tax=Aspergillus lacticoffeatus (strain CBS 101883) TaxID=1450533 RepID=UPI000D7F694E|nr:uncharacterized protein BO96DRAFT_437009 [Aspergillus niger CBS 101883]PYH53380.1 hypothetical protein BO96DRAFT_437009 [Aspergillus niger CBS 101883]